MRRGIKITLGAISLVAVVMIGYSVYLYSHVKSAADQMYEPREPIKQVSIVDQRGGGISLWTWRMKNLLML